MSTGSAPSPDPSSASPGGAPRREGNDSLWKRARRTLGSEKLGFLQQPTKSPGAPSSGPPAANKRREQVRQAQRTHRQRTQNYIKTLESEVVRLRESETNLIATKAELKRTISVLKHTLVSNNLPLPPGVGPDDSRASEPPQQQPIFDAGASVSYGQDQFHNTRLQVSWPEFSAQTPAPAYSQAGGGGGQYGTSQAYDDDSWSAAKPLPDVTNDSFNSPPAPQNQASPPKAVGLRSPQKQQGRVANNAVDTLENAIDFVLALEHPCMGHIPYPLEKSGHDPTNHMMLASTPLMAQAPQNPLEQGNSTVQWGVSREAIGELLNLSRSINPGGEITPIEAWNFLSKHPSLERLGKHGIELLKSQLSGHVRCEGFGAVIDEEVFWFFFNQLNDGLL